MRLRVSRWRVPVEQGFERTDDAMLRTVQPECVNRRAARRGNTGQQRAVPAEMAVPFLLARMEQPDRQARFRIARRDSRALSQRAMYAREGKIRRLSLAACDLRDHMIHMKGRGLADTRKPAILAASACSRKDACSETGWNRHGLIVSRL